MWILNWLPFWIFYAIFFLGIAGFLVTYLLKFIPIPAIYIYKTPIQIFSIILMIIGVYMVGAISNEEVWQSRINEVKAKLAEAEARSAQETIKVVERVVYREKIVREKGNDIIQYVDREVVKYDSVCDIPPTFVEALNRAAESTK